jgi:hypothetical protein
MTNQIYRPRFVEEAGRDGNFAISFPWGAVSDGESTESSIEQRQAYSSHLDFEGPRKA